MLSRLNFNYGFYGFNSIYNNFSLNSWNNNYFNNSSTNNNLFSFNNTNNYFINKNNTNLFSTNNYFTNKNNTNLFNTNNNSFWNNVFWTTKPALKLTENTQPTPSVDPKEPEPPIGPGGTRWEAQDKPFFSNLLGIDLNSDMYEFKFDEEGRIVDIKSKMESLEPVYGDSSSFGLMTIMNFQKRSQGYKISYDNNGNITISKYTQTIPSDRKGNPTGETKTTVNETKKYDKNGNEIKEKPDKPSGEIGSKEHIAKLLGLDLSNYKVSKTDDKGRALEISEQIFDGSTFSPIRGGIEYSISYNDTTGEISITPTQVGLCGAPTNTYTYNSEGRMVKSVSGNGSIYNAPTIVTEYAEDGSKTETKTYMFPADNNDIAKVVTKYNAKGEQISVENYDADGNVIYPTGLIQWEIDPFVIVGKDSEPRP